jgi:trans-aconitate methyltransferase
VYRELVEGIDADELTFELIAAAAPPRMLDVGCGMGELSERVAHELGVRVTAIDFSERMVELSRARGVNARLADVHTFGPDNGDDLLARRFRSVERHDAIGSAVFPDAASVRRFIAMTITRAHLADRVPDFEGELRTRSDHVAFVAREPR